ncbi:MAG TPA: hypothetical protein PKA06_13305, partial [Gemmatales bacterium]|nr:hypothetical protein [Gemmatales bacterium]
WDFGDGIYHVHNDAVVHEFPLPGKHLIKVRAVLGHQKGAPTVQELEVLPASGLQTASYNTASNSSAHALGAISVELTLRSLLSPEAITRERMQVVNLKGKASGAELKEYVRTAPGYKIHSVKLDGFSLKKSANVINESVTTAEDGKSAVVRAQLTQLGQEYSFHVAVQYVETVDPSAMKENQAVVTLPGVTSSLELPLGVKHEFELKYHGQTILKQQELPLRASEFTVEGRSYAVTCTKSGNRATFTFRSIPNRLQ